MRDFFIKRYPVMNTEQAYSEQDEYAVIRNHEYLISLDQKNGSPNSEPVDVVFTWVDNQDKIWQEKYNKYKNNTYDFIGLHAKDKARFENHNELYYSLLSVQKYLPWVRKIFIVTDEQVPEWLSPSDRVEVIDHKDIIPDVFLPTFNSHVIEAHLYKIKGLSENFIYFNDDVFVAREHKKEHFFRSNGLASIFVSNKSLALMTYKGVKTPTLAASLNVQQLLQKKFSRLVDSPLVHTYVSLKKSFFVKVWQEYAAEIESFLMNKFRANNDLNLATFFVPWYMYLSKESVITPEICYYFNVRSAHAMLQYRKLLLAKDQDRAPHSFCANDFSSDQQMVGYREQLESMLQKYYFDD